MTNFRDSKAATEVYDLRRRTFLKEISQAALGVSFWAKGACAQADLQSWKRMITDLEQQIPRLMQESAVPGASVAIIKDAKLFWRRGFGTTGNTSKQRVDPNTVFAAASMSKPVFAYFVLKLCERGVLDLDTPLTRYMPERYIENDPRLEMITARHVLCHTPATCRSGLTRTRKFPMSPPEISLASSGATVDVGGRYGR